jgi:formylglycine-generating enzyme required for sulfatase activity
VWEWCEDTYRRDCAGAPEDARPWTEGGEVWEWELGASPHRVLRGGSWYFAAVGCRSASRDGIGPSGRGPYLGFRPCLGPLDT